MKRAILYVRVSTDEQAEKGFSLDSQEEQLRKYCQSNHITVHSLYREDHSAKTFERPEFSRLFRFCKHHQKEVDLLLFVKWDRFSRNTRESYRMIAEFQTLNIEPCAIDQPLDLNVPESKIMLAIYLATPEVENDRRSINVFTGMRKAKKEGRYMGTAPLGYSNSRDEKNSPVIVPDENAKFVVKAFQEMATGNYTQEEIRARINAMGVKCSRNNFNKLIRNPVYCGRLYIPGYKDEPATYVRGRHKGIVDEALFARVQQVIGRRSPVNTTKSTCREEFPLRGFLQCHKCGKKLTASSGLSKTGRKYFYYHCTKGCKEIYRVEAVHHAFHRLLETIKIKKEVQHLYERMLKSLVQSNRSSRVEKEAQIQRALEKNFARGEKALQMMLDEELSSAEYRGIKGRLDESNEILNREKLALGYGELDSQRLSEGLSLLSNIESFYNRADVEVKQKLVGLIFPGNLVFENNEVQTLKMSPVLSLMSVDAKALGDKKRGLENFFSSKSPEVDPQGFKPRTS